MLKKAVELFIEGAVLSLLVMVGYAIAQESVTPPVPADQSQALALALFSAALPFAVALVRSALPKLPRVVVWALAPALGALVGLLPATNFSGWKGFLAGLLAIALRELVSTIKEHGING